MKIINLLILTIAIIANSAHAISFRDYYHAHEKEINEEIESRELILTAKDLTDIDGLDEIENIESIELLHLCSNRITAIPDWIGELKNLELLYLCHNKLTAIPDSIGDLTNLKELYLEDNQLTSIPSTLANLKQLQILDISDNILSTIPAWVGELPALRQVLVYNNPIRLSEKILRAKLNLSTAIKVVFKSGKKSLQNTIYSMRFTTAMSKLYMRYRQTLVAALFMDQ